MNTVSAHYCATSSTVSKPNSIVQPTRTKREYAITAKALDYGRVPLSAAVTRTYRVSCDLDFADRSTGRCKGCIWHKTETIAQRIGCSQRTVQRHLAALKRAVLVSRERRGNSSTLIRLNVLTASDAPPVDSTYPQTSLLSSPYKGTKETIRITNTKQLQSLEALKRYEAQFDDVVTHLISLGYDPKQAVTDFVAFGREELQQQIDNLYAYLRCGKPFHSYAKWLNWAIRAHHRICAQVQHEAVQTLELAARKVVRYAQVMDEETRTIHLVEIGDADFAEPTAGIVEHLTGADELPAAKDALLYRTPVQRHITRRAIPQKPRNDNPILNSGFWRPNHAALAFGLALQFPDYTCTVHAKRYGYG